MNAKAVAALGFFQIAVITICVITVNFCLHYALGFYNNKELYYDYSCWWVNRLPVMVTFHIKLQENAIFLYLIPLIWFIFSLRAVHRSSSPPLYAKLAYGSGIFVMIVFILITVDAAYLPRLLAHYCVQCCGFSNSENPLLIFWQYLGRMFG
jgi:hypothetical protein